MNFTTLSPPQASFHFHPFRKEETPTLTLQTPRVQAAVLPRVPQNGRRISASACPTTLSFQHWPGPKLAGNTGNLHTHTELAHCARSSQAETRISFSLISIITLHTDFQPTYLLPSQELYYTLMMPSHMPFFFLGTVRHIQMDTAIRETLVWRLVRHELKNKERNEHFFWFI